MKEGGVYLDEDQNAFAGTPVEGGGRRVIRGATGDSVVGVLYPNGVYLNISELLWARVGAAVAERPCACSKLDGGLLGCARRA